MKALTTTKLAKELKSLLRPVNVWNIVSNIFTVIRKKSLHLTRAHDNENWCHKACIYKKKYKILREVSGNVGVISYDFTDEINCR